MTLREEDLRACCYAVAEQIRTRRRTGAPIPEWLRRTHARLSAELVSAVSDDGPAAPPTARDSKVIGVSEAARILGCSTRHVRRLAADLDGQHAGREWVFTLRAVTEYARARKE
ncbi:hypothetical protein AB0H42_04315 [Nocardia sp. NPDC050799]|uniref:hypothetical protein n=1 Tax=Nocardia sp. NPDC050799 TaxID=3154842 RepID=UPI0033E9EAFD